MSEQCRSLIVQDLPADSDAFDGPHRRVADAIVALI